jgi:paraquat-inducible protein B
MNEETPGLSKAIIEKSRFGRLLWLVPVAAGLLCAWYAGHDIVFAGPTITIYFQSADGLQENNSPLQYLGVTIGEVKTLKLAPDRQRVAVTVLINPAAAGIAQQGAVFWIVRPELKLGSVSGLRTIVSGNFITVQPGTGARTNLFVGVEKEPIKPIPALDILLLVPKLGSLQPKSPVFYRDIQVGEVLDCRLGDDAREIIVHARIGQEYAPLVRVDSVFWNAGGINFHVGLFSGANISAESAQTLLTGGIEFATPPDFQDAATNGAVFVLNEIAKDDWQKWSPAIPLHSMPEAPKNRSTFPTLGSK